MATLEELLREEEQLLERRRQLLEPSPRASGGSLAPPLGETAQPSGQAPAVSAGADPIKELLQIDTSQLKSIPELLGGLKIAGLDNMTVGDIVNVLGLARSAIREKAGTGDPLGLALNLGAEASGANIPTDILSMPIAGLNNMTVDQALKTGEQAIELFQTRGKQGDPVARALNMGAETVRQTFGETGAKIGGARGGGMLAVQAAAKRGKVGAGLKVAKVIGEGLGSAFGLATSKLSKGQDVTFEELGKEASVSMAIDTPFMGAGPAIRSATSQLTRSGRRASSDMAATAMRDKVDDFFRPPSHENTQRLFKLVDASGDRLTPSALRPRLKNMGNEQFTVLLREVRKMSAPLDGSAPRFGHAFAETLKSIRDGGPGAVSIGLAHLQHARSKLLARINGFGDTRQIADSAARDSLNDAVEAIDDAIDNGRWVFGTGKDAAILKEARRQYKLSIDTADFGSMINRPSIIKPSANGRQLEFDFSNFISQLDHPTNRVGQRVKRALENRPLVKKDIEAFKTKLLKINLGATGELNANDMLGRTANTIGFLVGAGPQARERFRRLVDGQEGFVTMDDLGRLFNTFRRSAQQEFQTDIENSASRLESIGSNVGNAVQFFGPV